MTRSLETCLLHRRLYRAEQLSSFLHAPFEENDSEKFHLRVRPQRKQEHLKSQIGSFLSYNGGDRNLHLLLGYSSPVNVHVDGSIEEIADVCIVLICFFFKRHDPV